MKKITPTAIDLFSGAGGLSLGLVKAGGIPLAAVDNDLDSTKTYLKMFPMAKEVYHGDIEDWSPAINDKIDIIIGGPPCQGFSLARGQRFIDDPRNHLYKEFVRIVSKLNPKWIVIENVQGITSIGNGLILKQIYEEFAVLGYKLDHRVINMADYGVPQTRKRTVFVGSKTLDKFNWPEPTNTKENRITIHQALDDLPWALGNYLAHRANSQMRGPRNRDVNKQQAFTLRVRGDEFAFCKKPATGAFIPNPLPETIFEYRKTTSDYQQRMREKPPAWIKSDRKIPVVDKKKKTFKISRRLSIIEQARLQSFPDWFKFSGNPYSQARQIGNAVPPLFAEKLFKAIFQQMQEEINENKYIFQPPLGKSVAPANL